MGRPGIVDPDWRMNVMERVTERKSKNRKKRGWYAGGPVVQLIATTEFAAILNAAADKRGLNRSSWARRVLSVAAAAELGIPVTEVLQHTPTPTPPRGKGISQIGRAGTMLPADDGAGIEKWCFHPGCDGDHLVR